jgi:lipopolysaccharide/colanic/teichoic acid biosynthesis glycosyltransferase
LLADRLIAGTVLCAASPLIFISAAAIVLRSGRSPFIAHRRVGLNGTEFWMLKLRTMWPRGEAANNERVWVQRMVAEPYCDKLRDDPRIGDALARFCRKHSIDELPQLWHVLTGRMSLVGPRPVTEAEIRRYYQEAADEILSVRPGLTGLWQVSGRNRLSYIKRVELDLKLVRSLSTRTYFALLSKTVPVLFSGDGAW